MERGENRDRTGQGFDNSVVHFVKLSEKDPRNQSHGPIPGLYILGPEDMWLEVFVAIPRFRGLKNRRKGTPREKEPLPYKNTQERTQNRARRRKKRFFPSSFLFQWICRHSRPKKEEEEKNPPPPSQCVFRTLSIPKPQYCTTYTPRRKICIQ